MKIRNALPFHMMLSALRMVLRLRSLLIRPVHGPACADAESSPPNLAKGTVATQTPGLL